MAKFEEVYDDTLKLFNFMTDYDVIIQINEPIFDQLEDNQKDYIVKDLLAQVVYDIEKDKLTIVKPDITTFSGVLRQYDIDTYSGIKESIASLLEQKKIQMVIFKPQIRKGKVCFIFNRCSSMYILY